FCLFLLAPLSALGQAPPIGPRYEHPPGAIGPPPRPCEVRLSMAQKRAGRRVRLVARATNLTQETITLTAPDACPAGPVRFMGLPAGYDYYGTCNAGACRGPRDPVRWTLAPGQTVELASI